jgi:hypothetical protein
VVTRIVLPVSWVITLLSARRNHRSIYSPVQLDDIGYQSWGFLEGVHSRVSCEVTPL